MTDAADGLISVDSLCRAGVLDIGDGYRVRNVELGPCGIPFVRGGDIGTCGDIAVQVHDHVRPEFAERVKSKLAQPGDVVFITKGTVGRVGYVQPQHAGVVFAPQVCTWRSKDPRRLNSRFLYYLLTSTKFKAELDAVKTHGSMVADYVSLSDQRRFRLPIPPIHEQRAISEALGSLDDKIELNRRMSQTLEEMARALFKSWFIDFDPVRAKAAGQTPPGLDPHTAALFPDVFQDSPLGPIPAGGEVQTIGQAVRVLGGGTPRTKEPAFWDGGTYPFCTPKDMSSLTSPVLLDTERHITDAGVAKISSGQLPAGTVVLSSRAPIGYLAITECPVSVNQGIIAMICDGDLPNHYVLQWAMANMDLIEANANGSTFMEISKKNFRPIPVLVPDAPVLSAFVKIVEPLHRRIVNNLRESNALATTRDALLPKLLSGEAKVDTERRASHDA